MERALSIIIVTILLVSIGCRKDIDPIKDNPIEDPISDTSTILDIKWKVLFRTDTTSVTFYKPMFYDNYVVFCTHNNNSDLEYGIGVFHKQTGERHPAWQQSLGNMIDGSAMSDWTLCGPNNRIAVLFEYPKLFAYDLATGQQIWQHNHIPYVPINSIYGTFSSLYHPSTYSHSFAQDLSNLMKFHPETGARTKIWAHRMGDDFKTRIESVAEWIIEEKGTDTLLFFLNSGYRFSDFTARSDAYAYSLTKKENVWSKANIFKKSEAASVPPVVVGNKVIFQSSQAIVCLNTANGEELWRHTETKEFFPKRLQSITADGKLFVRYHYGVMAFDVNTGALLWKTPPDFYIPSKGAMDYYQGKLFFTGSKDWKSYLYCLDGASGDVMWKEHAGYLRYGVIIDQQTGYLYISSGRYIYCIDLNTTPRY